MPKRISKNLKDTNEIAAAVFAASITDAPPNESSVLSKIMAEMGRRGGKIGGKAAAANMTAKERKARAKKAAKARWKSHKTPVQ